MSKQLPLTFITVLLCISAFAKGNYASVWQKGNSAYQQKKFDSAAYYYNQIAEQEANNAEVYYNLGNTYYKLNNIGGAVLNYERALKINPGYKQASDNLYLTQSRINNRIQHMPEIFFVQWWKAMTRANLANTYAVIAVLLFLILLAYHITKRLRVTSFHAPVQLSAAVIVLSAVFIILSVVSATRLVSSREAVIMQEGTPMMQQPKYGTSQSLIPEGTKVEICNEKADWYEVTLPDGRTGWLQKSTIAKI